MPSADHSRQALLRQADWLASVSSPRVRTNSFPSCTFGLYIAVSVWLLGFNLFGSLTRQHMPETVSVRKVNGLPRASFSRNLAVQALPLAMCLAPPPAFRDFHPIEFAHAERTKREAPLSQGLWLLIYCLHRSVLRCSNDLAIFDVFEILDADGIDVDYVVRVDLFPGFSFRVNISHLQSLN